EVDPVRAQPTQGCPAGPPDVPGRDIDAAGHLLLGIKGVAKFGSNRHLIPVPGQGPAKHLLAVAGAVYIGGVEERDPELQCAQDRRYRLVIVDRTPALGLAVQHDRPTARPAAEPYLPALDPALPKKSGHCRLLAQGLRPSAWGMERAPGQGDVFRQGAGPPASTAEN